MSGRGWEPSVNAWWGWGRVEESGPLRKREGECGSLGPGLSLTSAVLGSNVKS